MAPQILSFGPGAGRTIGGTDPLVQVTFNEAMDPATLDATRIRLIAAGQDETLGTSDDVVVSSESVGYLERAHAALLQFSALPPGDYRVVVADTVTDASGNRLGGTASSDFRVFVADLREGGSFVAEGRLPADGVRDEYAFLARAGQNVYFNLESAATLGLEWSVRDDQGGEVFRGLAIGDRGVVTLPRDGRYRLNLLRTGEMDDDYRVSVWDVPPPQEFPLEIGETVSDGVPAAGAGRIETPGALDRYAFTATAGQKVYFDLISGASAGLAWRLEDETGAAVFDGGFIGDAGVVTLVRGGSYTLTLGHLQRDFTGPYSFKLWNVPAPQDFNLAIGDTVSDGVPAAGAGRIESPGALDRYLFTAAPGQQVFFDLLSGANAGLAWQLSDSNGDEIFDAGFIGDVGPVTLSLGGAYTLTLGHLKRDFIGPYSFQLRSNP
jgi:hypothetical protein